MCRVLIVDDDKVRLSRIQRLVLEIVPGCDVECKTSFLDAKTWLNEIKDHADEKTLDLTISDLFLQGSPPEDPGEGVMLIQDVIQQFPECPCILISGIESLADLKQRLPYTRGVRFVSLHYTAQSMWGQLREYIADALVAHAAAAGSLR